MPLPGPGGATGREASQTSTRHLLPMRCSRVNACVLTAEWLGQTCRPEEAPPGHGRKQVSQRHVTSATFLCPGTYAGNHMKGKDIHAQTCTWTVHRYIHICAHTTMRKHAHVSCCADCRGTATAARSTSYPPAVWHLTPGCLQLGGSSTEYIKIESGHCGWCLLQTPSNASWN